MRALHWLRGSHDSWLKPSQNHIWANILLLDDLPTDLPCPDSQDVTADWTFLLVHNVKRLKRERNILEERVTQLEVELENAREEIQQLKA